MIIMICSNTAFTPLKIAAIVVGGIAIVTHITAVAYPEWDGIDALWTSNGISIKSQGSLWDLTIEDNSNAFFQSVDKIETSWKKPIVLMATTGIGAGVVGVGVIVLTALLDRCTENLIVHVCAKMLASTFILCAGWPMKMPVFC